MEHKLIKAGCECGCPHVPGLDKLSNETFLQLHEEKESHKKTLRAGIEISTRLAKAERLVGELRVALRKACSEWKLWVEGELSGTDGYKEATDEIRMVEAVAVELPAEVPFTDAELKLLRESPFKIPPEGK